MSDRHRNPIVSFRVPVGEAEEWKSVFRQALTLGLSASAVRLATDGGALEALWDPLEQALPDVREHWPGPGEPPDTPDGLLEWLTTLAPDACTLWDEVRTTEQALAQAQQELARLRREAAGVQTRAAAASHDEVQAIRDRITAEQERWQLTREGTHMVAAMAEAGWTTEELIAWGTALKASGADPGQLVDLWQRLGGLEGQIAALMPQLQQLDAMRQQLQGQIPQWAQKAQAAEADYHQAQQLQEAARRGIEALEGEVSKAQVTAQQWRLIAGALGWWIPDIGQAWTKVQGQPAGIERALAATLLLHAIQATGDAPLTIPGRTDAQHFRLPVQVHLSELLTALAPPEMVQPMIAQIQEGRETSPPTPQAPGNGHAAPPQPDEPPAEEDPVLQPAEPAPQ